MTCECSVCLVLPLWRSSSKKGTTLAFLSWR